MTVAEMVEAPVEPTTSMVLTQALEVLNATGWCKEQFSRKDGAHCMVGAIHSLNVGAGLCYSALNALGDACGSSVTRFNDYGTTTWEDVVHVYNQAIKATTPKDEINGS